MNDTDEDYILPQTTLAKAIAIRASNKFTMAEIANKLHISLNDLNHDFDLRRREIEGEDD